MMLNMIRETWIRLQKSVLPAVFILAFFGILEGIGYALCPAAMQGGGVTTTANHIGWLIARTASAVYDNRGFLFAVCVGYELSGKTAEGAAAGLIGVLLFNSFSASPFFIEFWPAVLDSPVDTLALYGPNACTGILFGIAGAAIITAVYKKTHPIKALIAGLAVLPAMTVGLLGLRIVLFELLVPAGNALVSLGPSGSGLYASLNRLLAPFELHRPLNYAVLSEFGAGDMSRYWAMMREGDPGRYMSGFFAPMMAGVPSACLLMRRRCLKNGQNRRGLLFLLFAVSAFIAGLCEPFEYWLLLVSPIGYLLYVTVFGLCAWASVCSGFRAGFACSGGLVDFVFSSALPAASRSWLLLPLCIGAALFFILLFSLIRPESRPESDIMKAADDAQKGETI